MFGLVIIVPYVSILILMVFKMLESNIDLIIGFLAGLFGSKIVDYLTDKIYYRARPRNKKLVIEGRK